MGLASSLLPSLSEQTFGPLSSAARFFMINSRNRKKKFTRYMSIDTLDHRREQEVWQKSGGQTTRVISEPHVSFAYEVVTE